MEPSCHRYLHIFICDKVMIALESLHVHGGDEVAGSKIGTQNITHFLAKLLQWLFVAFLICLWAFSWINPAPALGILCLFFWMVRRQCSCFPQQFSASLITPRNRRTYQQKFNLQYALSAPEDRFRAICLNSYTKHNWWWTDQRYLLCVQKLDRTASSRMSPRRKWESKWEPISLSYCKAIRMLELPHTIVTPTI